MHDDVVDESLQRRGKTTANIVWDNKSSNLVGELSEENKTFWSGDN